MNESNQEIYETPQIDDIENAIEVTKGESPDASKEEQIFWADFSAPVGRSEE